MRSSFLMLAVVIMLIFVSVEISAKKVKLGFDDIFVEKVTTDPRYSDSSYILFLKHSKLSARKIKFWNKEINKHFFDAKALILVDYADATIDEESWSYVFAKQEANEVNLDTAGIDSAFSVQRYLRQAWTGIEKLDSRVGASGWLVIILGLILVALGLWLAYKLIKVISKEIIILVTWSFSMTKKTINAITQVHQKAKQARRLRQEQRRIALEAEEAERKAQAIKERDERQIKLPANLAQIAKIIIDTKLTGTIYNCPFCEAHGIKHENLKDHFFKKCRHTKGNDVLIGTIKVNMFSDYCEPQKIV